MDFEFAQWDVCLRRWCIVYKTMLQTNERSCWPSVAGLRPVSGPLHLAAFGMRGQTAETLESKP